MVATPSQVLGDSRTALATLEQERTISMKQALYVNNKGDVVYYEPEDKDPEFVAKLTLEQMYLLSELLRSRIKDLKDFTNAEREIAQAKATLKTLGTAKPV